MHTRHGRRPIRTRRDLGGVCHRHRPAYRAGVDQSDIPPSPVKPYPAVLIRVSALDDVAITEYEHLEALIRASASSTLPANDDGHARIVIVGDEQSARMFFTFRHEGQWKVYPYRTVRLESEPSRISPEHANLGAKKVENPRGWFARVQNRGHACQKRRSVLPAHR